ncbi:MAG: response regulator [Rickettsiales bacterium]|nr:response regulator [Rickettsiales bacterium]
MNRDLKILIAEDDALNMRLFKDVLETKMVQTICIAERGDVFKKILENMPDLVLIDVGITNFASLDIIKKIRRNKITSQIPFMVLTTLTKTIHHKKILKSGCANYMVKPFSISAFLEKIQEIIPLQDVKELFLEEQFYQATGT